MGFWKPRSMRGSLGFGLWGLGSGVYIASERFRVEGYGCTAECPHSASVQCSQSSHCRYIDVPGSPFSTRRNNILKHRRRTEVEVGQQIVGQIWPRNNQHMHTLNLRLQAPHPHPPTPHPPKKRRAQKPKTDIGALNLGSLELSQPQFHVPRVEAKICTATRTGGSKPELHRFRV